MASRGLGIAYPPEQTTYAPRSDTCPALGTWQSLFSVGGPKVQLSSPSEVIVCEF